MKANRFEGYLVIAALACLGLWLIACIWYPLTDTDIWWHLASAKSILASRAFLREDPFCQVSLGAPWTDLHWGFQILAYGLWKLGGATALIVGKCLALLAAVALVWWPNWNRRSGYLVIPLLAMGMYLARFYVDVRPLVVTLLVLGAQYALIQLHFQGRWRHPWLLVIPLQIILVNVQGLFPLGAFMLTCLILEKGFTQYLEGRKPWYVSKGLLVTVLAAWLAGLANPYGWHGFILPAALFERIIPISANIFSEGIAENGPFLALLHSRPQEAWPWLGFVATVLVTFSAGRLRTNLGHLILFLVFTALGLMAVRNLPLVLLSGLMAASANLKLVKVFFSRGAGLAAFMLIVLFYGPNLIKAWAYELPGKLETPFRFPTFAVNYLEAHPLPGNIFNELRYGGYLGFRLFPGKLAFIDGRMILRSADFYRDFLDVVDNPKGFEKYRAGYGITHALLPISEDRRFLPLAVYLLGAESWNLLHCDGASALLSAPGIADHLALSLDSLPLQHSIRTELHARFGANARLESLAWRNTSDFLAAAGWSRASREAHIFANP